MSVIKDTNVYVTIANTGEFDVRHNMSKTEEHNTLENMKSAALRSLLNDPKGDNHLFTWVAKNLSNNLDQISFSVESTGDYDEMQAKLSEIKQELIAVLSSIGYNYRKA